MIYMKIELSDLDEIYILKYPDVNYNFFRNLIEFRTDKDIIGILDNLLLELDCTQVFCDMQVLSTKHLVYDTVASKYYYYLIRLDNQLLYNSYLDIFINNHVNNLLFEIALAKTALAVKPKTVTKGNKPKRTVKNGKYVRQVTTDLFTGKETYIYSRVVNGITETTQSDDPNLLETLNAKPARVKKEKASKVVGVPLSAMMFSFKKKK